MNQARYEVSSSSCKTHDCNGSGFVPVKIVPRMSRLFRTLWFLAEAKETTEDGWHFVPCPTCQPASKIVKLAQQMTYGAL